MVCYCTCVSSYAFKRQHPNPNTPIGYHLGMHARSNASASPVRGSICLESPDLERFRGGGVYIGVFLEHSPSRYAPWGRAIDGECQSVLHSQSGRPPNGPLQPCHLSNGENTKAWDWIADGNSDPNKLSHLRGIRKSISSMKKTIVDGGNNKNSIVPGERENLPWKDEKGKIADSNSSKWMILHRKY